MAKANLARSYPGQIWRHLPGPIDIGGVVLSANGAHRPDVAVKIGRETSMTFGDLAGAPRFAKREGFTKVTSAT
jgi:hypothetical protein